MASEQPQKNDPSGIPVDQGEIDKEIEALLSDSSGTGGAESRKTAPEKEDYISQAAAMDMRIGSSNFTTDGDAPVSKSSKIYAARHPLAMFLALLIAAGGVAAIFLVSLKVGTCILLGALFFHLASLAFLDGRKVKLLMLATAVILGLVIYFSLPKTECCDGTYSYSTGSGTCSYHGGMAKNGCKK